MLPLGSPDRIHVAFDDHRLVANAGLLLPVTLAHHLGLGELVDRHVDLGDAPGRANPGDKLLTLVASALAGGDCIDDADVLRTGGTASAIGCVVKAPSTLGTFLRSFRWGHVRQLDRVSREFLARAWAAGAGPGDAPLTIDLDSTICETYGLGKEGARRHGYNRPAGLSPAAGRGRGHRRRADGAAAPGSGQHRSGRGPLPAGDGGPGALRRSHRTTHDAGRQRLLHPRHGRRLPQDGRPLLPSPSASTKACATSSRPYPRRTGRPSLTGWTAAPTWPRLNTHPSSMSPTPRQRVLIVRRVQPAPGSQLALLIDYSYHACITDREGDTLELEADHRRHAEIENAIRDLKYGVPQSSSLGTLPRQRRLAGGAGHGPPLARWTARIGLGELVVTTKTLRRRFFSWPDASPEGPSPHPAPSQGLAWENQFSAAGAIASPAAPFLTPPSASDPSTGQSRGCPADSCQPSPRVSLLASGLADFAYLRHRAPPRDAALPPAWPPRTTLNSICRNQAWSVRLPVPIIPRVNASTVSLRWIRAKCSA